ncbi:dihydromonapterin reductase [Shewanella oneidensis MR-1]|uniref:Dihydromonapterin reductase n=1 Tax=Shewanella oneidensis (strain ATCC 700550 / JCM 31522 / CIP 106686 / LMG 19005 / NCIMB 14063 / MR-1) TaxID=211586 RepID=Q8EIR4_SHEON|nr:dihydromonapterin reductase [Shewanella oneidensis]AAN53848.1 dihydrofolate reductase FolM [Shewanella oneidensis MR-1]MDX5997320.1 dihydromonapterin reductase [Shewanella oneidensis]MEE2028552.1 Dihydromonapterin reductase [Shewanella oneidensis]QKG95640.1 dihydromonapterin reductase [Shewanella oneidensis MR-1]
MTAPIIITGVGKRIGYALAKHLLAQGHKVIGTYRSHYPSIDELQSLGATLIQCDFYDNAQVQNLIEQLSQYPKFRAIIHNASDWLADNSPEFAAHEVMQRMIQVHVNVPYQMNLALASKLQAGAEGEIGASDIIHITDYVAEKGSAKHIAYAASKAALDNLTLSFAAKLAPEVKVNAIAPAMILFNPSDDEAYRQKTLAKAILPKEAGNHEIIELMEYLLNSRYVTGRSHHVDGGRHLR